MGPGCVPGDWSHGDPQTGAVFAPNSQHGELWPTRADLQADHKRHLKIHPLLSQFAPAVHMTEKLSWLGDP